MNNLFVAISDIHISIKNLEVSLKVLNQALEKARELHCPLIIAGDLNDTKAVMRSEWVEALIDLFSNFSDVEVHIIDGNHDKNNRAGSASSLGFLNLLSNVMVYNEFDELDIPSCNFRAALIPYCNTKEDFLDNLDRARASHLHYIICHQGFRGAFMGDYVVDDSSVDPKELEDFTLVLSGHYHKHQWLDNIMYFGSPFTVNFGESNQEKFIWVAEGHEGKVNMRPILTDVRRHIQKVWTEVPKLEEGEVLVPRKHEDLFKVILKGTKEFCLGVQLDKVQSLLGSKNVTLVPEIIKQSEHRISSDIVHSPIKVIENYLENCETDFDKEELKNLLFSIVSDVLNNVQSRSNKQYRITKATGKNFLSYKSFEYDYESKNLTLIQGYDEDYGVSTGAGKSSFLDLPTYGIFGKTSKDLKADEVINRSSKRDLEIELHIQGPEGTIVVKRYRRHSQFDTDLFFTINGGEPIRGKDNRETQKLLEDTIGVSFDMFLRSSYFTQFGSIDRFLSASDTDKKKIISEVTDTQVYDNMTDVVKEEIKLLKSKFDELDRKDISLSAETKEISDQISNLKFAMDEFEKDRNNTVKELRDKSNLWQHNHEIELDSIEKKITNYDVDLKNQIASLEEKKLDWDSQESAKIEEEKSYIEQLKLKIEETKGKVVIPERPDFESQEIEINNKLGIIQNLEKEIDKIDAEIFSQEKTVSSFKSDIEVAKSRESKANCLSCYQPISKEHIDKHIRQIQGKIDAIEVDILSLRSKKSSIKSSIQVKEKLLSALDTISANKYEHSSKLKSIVAHQETLRGLEESLSRAQDSLKERQVNPYVHQIEQKKGEKNPFLYEKEALLSKKNPHPEVIDKRLAEKNPYEEMLNQSIKKLEERNQALKETVESKFSTNKRLKMAEWWKEALHVYIKSYLTDSFLEQINASTNEILFEEFDGLLSIDMSSTTERNKSTKEKIDVKIYNKNEECSYNSLSGGERCRICFALNVSIAKVLKNNSGISFNFIMFDEVLNGLDEIGKSQVMRILKRLESEYETIFVIDHATEFKSLFTNSIEIRKSQGISQIVQ